MKNIDFSHVSSSDIAYIDQLYDQYLQAPDQIEPSWQHFFQGMEFASTQGMSEENGPDSSNASASSGGISSEGDLAREFKVFRIIQSFRARGHLIAKTNPIRARKDRHARLNLADYGLSEADREKTFVCGEYLGLGRVSLNKILEHMDKVYCRSVGVEFMQVTNTDMRRWFRDRIEGSRGEYSVSVDKKKRILEKLNQAVIFESFLSTKYVGQKRFSLEGGENTIAAIDAIINQAVDKHQVEEVVIGMAHRGRLNVLANILGKTYEYIFNEFEGGITEDLSFGDGDVKYHLGFSSEVETPHKNKSYLKLMPNPSHLEAVGPVVQGYCRAQSDILHNEDKKKVLPILIHGDAAVAGQGIVYESVQMSRLDGYKVGGTIHFIINNQIGFTTDFDDARSSSYCTSAAMAINVPVIHVNGDDAEAVAYAVELATDFRQEFGEDIFIDMVCYRRHGHNEGDEPKFTQPLLYKKISKHPNPRDVYINKLVEGRSIEVELAQTMEREFKNELQDRFNSVKQKTVPFEPQSPDKEWANLHRAQKKDFELSYPTGVSREQLEEVYHALVKVPDDIKPIRKALKVIEDRKKKWNQSRLDWGMAELLAYGCMLRDGINIRMSGQDCIRGTFSHRHAMVFDENANKKYHTLNHINKDQAKFRIYNSLLSEYAVLAYEYGYSLGRPTDINIWEAQFGDFANGAQTVFDQFVSAGESKWQRMSGLITYLPHGYEGQGPEHSNARPERFLQLAAEYNMIVANCTTPANLFHLLRRHVSWPFRKPLVLFTPKSLLRHPACVSTIEELTNQGFQEVIEDPRDHTGRTIIFCSGKVFYDLDEYRQAHKLSHVGIYRMEQLYPFPQKHIKDIMDRYPGAEFKWVQEEPENMGAWSYLHRFEETRSWSLVGRKISASPATGFGKIHKQEQTYIIKKALE